MGNSPNSSLINSQYGLYLTRYAHQPEYLEGESVTENLYTIVTIPCFNEPNILTTLESIYHCHPTKFPVEILILINHPKGSPKEVIRQNKISFKEVISWMKSHNDQQKKFHVIWTGDLPVKHAGVGFARKIVMDEAIRRLLRSGMLGGIIVGLDADSTCDQNYLREIEEYFHTHPETNGANIYFEHPIKSNFEDKNNIGIASYELHLRYMVHALRYTRFPYAFHAVGSSLAVRGSTYVKQGGMNRRKAGEDFYFLQKIIPLGNFGEINTTRVIPSGRESNRVPFGTGKAMMKWSESGDTAFKSYNPEIYEELYQLFSGINNLFDPKKSDLQSFYGELGPCMKKFISLSDWINNITRIQSDSTSLKTFRYRFYQWMNGLNTLKFIHFARDTKYRNVPVIEAYQWLKKQIGLKESGVDNVFEGLFEIRNFDRENPWYFKYEQIS
jgi:hypothetical protein